VQFSFIFFVGIFTSTKCKKVELLVEYCNMKIWFDGQEISPDAILRQDTSALTAL